MENLEMKFQLKEFCNAAEGVYRNMEMERKIKLLEVEITTAIAGYGQTRKEMYLDYLGRKLNNIRRDFPNEADRIIEKAFERLLGQKQEIVETIMNIVNTVV